MAKSTSSSSGPKPENRVPATIPRKKKKAAKKKAAKEPKPKDKVPGTVPRKKKNSPKPDRRVGGVKRK